MAEGYSAGEASIKIVPDASDFLKKLEADLKAKKAQFDVPVGADTTRAGTEIDRFRAEQENRPVKIRVDVDKSSLDQMKKGLSEAGSALGSALKFNLGAAGIGELPALATALTTVAGAVQQLAGAGAVLPGVFAGVAADVGTAKLALLGVGDAFKAVEKASDGSAKNVQAANEALAKLAPNAADFVKSVASLKPAFDGLQKDVQGKFFAGLGQEVKDLAHADLPLLQKGLGGIADAFNQNLKQLGASLSSGSSQGLLDRILGNTGDAQARLSKAIDPIIHAFGTLAATGSDTLPRLADGVGKLADRFDHFITAADSSGKLDKWINDGIAGFDHLGNTLLNIGKIVTDLTGAAGGGGGLLNWLDQGSSKLQAFLSSAQGQETLRKFFADGREELQQLLPILQNLGPIAAGAFQAARDATGIWLPVIKEATDVLAQDPGLVHAVADAFLAWKFVGVITGVVDAVKGLTTALGLVGPAAATAGTEAAAGLAPLAAALGPIAAALAAITAGSAAYFAGTAGDSQTPGVGTPTDPTGSRGLQDRATGTSILGVPSVVNDPAFAPHYGQPPSPPPAATSDLPPAVKPQFPAPRSPVVGPGPGVGGVAPPVGAPPLTQPGPTGPVPQNPLLFPYGRAAGGVLPGYSPGVDNMLVPMSGGEGVIVPTVTRKLGPAGIAAINRGALTRGYAGGGIVDEFGNPVTPGPAPGQAGVAPNPYQGGGIGGIFSKIASGVQGPIGNALSIGTSLAGAAQGGGGKSSFADRASTIPGLWGAIGSAFSSDPGTALTNWGTQTGQWLGNFAAKTAGSFGSALWSGALGLVGLDNSILSPNNPWTRDAMSVGDFALGNDGPIGKLLGGPEGSTGSGSDSTSSADLAALQKSGVAHLPADRAGSSVSSSPGADRANAYAQAHAVGQPYQYGGIGPNYDCSGIASAIYAAAKGLPEGTRYFTTESDFTALGFVPGFQPGALNVGIRRGGGGPNSHMALTLPNGVNVESGGSGNTTKYGGTAAGAQGFPIEYHLVLPGSGGAGAVPGLYSAGGAASGRGGPRSDEIPAWLSNGEHVLSASDVNAMGGQKGVYAFRNALHRSMGGPIPLADPRGSDPHGGPNGEPSLGPFAPWWDMDWMPPEHPGKVGPGAGKWWSRGPTTGGGGGAGHFGPPIGKNRKPLPSDQPPPDWQIKGWGFADGGAVTGYVDPRQPLPRPPDAHKIAPRPQAPSPSQISPRQSAPSPSQIGPPQLQPPATSPAPPAPPAQPPGPSSGGAGGGGRQTSAPQLAPGPSGDALNHNLPAIRTGIASAATTLGNIASQAIAAGMGGAGIPGGGAAGQFAAGLFQQGGKIVDDIVNVGSSFLVGSVPGSFGTTTPGAYGETLRTPQNVPHTAQGRGGNSYQFNGMDVPKVFQELDLRDNIAQQAALAHRRTR
jgi:hypothetical protein